MYEADDHDVVVQLENIPQSSVGAPTPAVLATENSLHLIYYLEDTPDEGQHGTSIKETGPDSESEIVAVVSFSSYYAHMFGPPNDEAFRGHPLSSKGLKPYSAFKIKESSWLRKLENINSCHEAHNKKLFMKDKKHFIFIFHDSTFECIAQSYSIEVHKNSIQNVVSLLSNNLS